MPRPDRDYLRITSIVVMPYVPNGKPRLDVYYTALRGLSIGENLNVVSACDDEPYNKFMMRVVRAAQTVKPARFHIERNKAGKGCLVWRFA
jgi:hypothetical protein